MLASEVLRLVAELVNPVDVSQQLGGEPVLQRVPRVVRQMPGTTGARERHEAVMGLPPADIAERHQAALVTRLTGQELSVVKLNRSPES